ncbi:MAG: hypothetical protein ACRYFR_12765 [Janthinobacterium lividum]
MLSDSTSYEPVRWGKMAVFRASDEAALDLPDAGGRYAAAQAKFSHDSAGYALVAANARQFHVSAQDVASVQQVYQRALVDRDAARATLRRASAAQHDTTRLGYRLAHVFRAKNPQGQLVLDSAGFMVNLRSVVIANVPAHQFFFATPSNRARFLGLPPEPATGVAFPVTPPPALPPPNASAEQPVRR